MRELRVAMLTQAFYPHVGGAERQILALAPLLAERGVAIDVLTKRYAGLDAFELVQGIPVHRLPIPGPKPVAALSYSMSAIPILKRLQPDLIHAHELLSPATTAVLAKRVLGFPSIAKVLRGGQLGDIAKIMRRRVGRVRMKALCKMLDGFVVISKEIEEELAAHGVPQEKRYFIPNGVDINRFRPVQNEKRLRIRKHLGLDLDAVIVVFAGRLVAEKRVDMLLRCWQTLGDAADTAKLLVLGDGEEHGALLQLAGQGVAMLGQQDRVADYLQAADIFVLPSSTEGLSNAILEAMATGLAVIATEVGGAPDVIEHKTSGWLIKPDDETDLIHGLEILIADDALRGRLGAAARAFVVEHYALEQTADKLRNLYDQIILRGAK